MSGGPGPAAGPVGAPAGGGRGRRPVLVILGIAATLLLALGAGLLVLLPERLSLSERLDPLVERYGGSPLIGGPFALQDMNGGSVTQQAGSGRLTLLFFGFTHCPDVCPTALLTVAQALDRLPAEQAERFRPLFVSVDPERDTPEVLRGYVSLFHPAIVGATASPAEIAAMAKLYRAYYAKVDLGAGDYTVDHSTMLYLLDGEGRNLALFNHQTKAERLAEALSAFAGALEAEP